MDDNCYIKKINKYIDKFGIYLSFKNITLDNLTKDLIVLDECAEFLLDLFCQFGLNADFEPNEDGLDLENCIDFINNIRIKHFDNLSG